MKCAACGLHVLSSCIVAQLVQVAHHPPGAWNLGLFLPCKGNILVVLFLLLLPVTVINAYSN